MKGIILAAGRGSRMGSLTTKSHKSLCRLHGSQLIDIQIQKLKLAGINEVGIITGYKHNLLKNKKVTKFFHNKIWEESNMVYSLYLADEWLSSEKCIVSYSDIFYSPSAINSLKESKNNISITFDKNWLKLCSIRFKEPLSDAESFRFNSNNELIEIGRKENNLEKIMGQYMGLLHFTPSGWKEFKNCWKKLSYKEQLKVSITEVLQNLIKQDKQRINVVPYDKDWGEIDTESDLRIYEKIFSKTILF